MQPPSDRALVMPLALGVSAFLMAGMAVAFWTRLIDVGEVRTLATALVALTAVADLGLALFFYSRSKS